MSEILTTLAAVFIVSSLILAVTESTSQPSIPGYILAGVLMSVLGFSLNEEFIQIGAAMLVFIFGLKTEPERLKKVADDSLTTTLVVAGIAGGLSFLFAGWNHFSLNDQIFIGISGAASSSLIGLQLMREDIRADVLHGKLSESIHLMQDVGVVLLIAVFSGLITGNGYVSVLATGSILVVALFLRSTALKVVEPRIESSRELAMLTALTILTGFVSVGSSYGVPLFASSFAAGLSLSKFPYNMETLETLGPVKDFFSVSFFVAVGTLANFPTSNSLSVALSLILVAGLTKPLIAAFHLLYRGHDSRTAYLTGLSLDQVGEFPLILAVQAFVSGIISPGAFQSITAAAAATMFMSSYTSRHDEKIYEVLSELGVSENGEKVDRRSNAGDISDHIILVGMDQQGTELAEFMEENDQNFLVIDNNPDRIMEAQEQDYRFVFGDVMDDATWRKANLEVADLVVSTIPVSAVSERIISVAGEVEKFVRSEEVEEARRLMDMGADFVQVPDIMASSEVKTELVEMHDDPDYREELRRKNLLEIRRHLNVEEES